MPASLIFMPREVLDKLDLTDEEFDKVEAARRAFGEKHRPPQMERNGERPSKDQMEANRKKMEAVFSQPLTRDPIELLKGAERAQFGASGCGIDWLRPDVQASPSPAGLSEQVFRGDVCNCQGRVCRDLQGNVRALQWRSAC